MCTISFDYIRIWFYEVFFIISFIFIYFYIRIRSERWVNKWNKKERRSKKRKLIVILLIISIIFCLIKSFSKKEQETISQENSKDDEITVADITEITEKSSFPTDVFGIPVHTELIESNTKARPGTKRRIRYIVIHETDNEVVYHTANEIGNLYGIGIELCVNNGGNFEKTFNNAAKLVAYLLKEYNLTIYDLKTHHDFSGKDCPHSILKNNRMDEFIEKVEKYM